MSADKQTQQTQQTQGGVSNKVKLAIGAASLFLFIVGVKRTFRSDDSPLGGALRDEPGPDGGAEEDAPRDRAAGG